MIGGLKIFIDFYVSINNVCYFHEHSMTYVLIVVLVVIIVVVIVMLKGS